MKKAQLNKLAMSWNIAVVREETIFAAIEKYGGKEVSLSYMGRGALMMAEFPNDEQAHQCLITLEVMEMHVEIFKPMKVNLN